MSDSAALGSRVPANAHALSMFRVLPNGDGRRYSAVTFPQGPYAGCERMIRMARKLGWIGEEYADAYGVLDVLNDSGDIVADYPIPDARAFRALKKKLALVVEADG